MMLGYTNAGFVHMMAHHHLHGLCNTLRQHCDDRGGVVVIAQFEQLGNTVATLWEKAGSTPDSFAEIATTALANSRVLTIIEPKDIVTWLINGNNVPGQNASDFGQPPVNVYVGNGFYIQVLFWLDSTTAIHEHAFSGAFGVLAGSSVQSTYTFDTQQVASDRLIVGHTRFVTSELLYRGDVRSIYSGDKLIHSLFHLERPSLSVVVRTSTKADEKRPQYAYLRPYLAFDDLNPPRLQSIQLRMLESLFQTDRTAFWESAGQIVGSCEPFMLSQVLAMAYQASDAENWNTLLGKIGGRNKELIKYIVPCLTENSRIHRIVGLRSSVHDSTHRFFLALLLNVPAREEIYRLISTRYPSDDPQALCLKWLGEIFSEQRMGIKLTLPLLFIIERLLLNPDFESSRTELKKHFQTEDDEEISRLQPVWRQLYSLDVLQPLFTTYATLSNDPCLAWKPWTLAQASGFSSPNEKQPLCQLSQ